MPMKAKTKVNPRIAAMNAARAAKKAAAQAPAPKKRVTAQEEVKDYGNAYGDASGPIERRRTGTQPNSRAKSAVERAQERLETRRSAPAQPPGMDVGYDADAELEDFYEEDDVDTFDPDDEEVFPTEDELEDAQERMSAAIAKRNSKAGGTRGARMAPIGRAETGRGLQRQPIRRNGQGRIMVMDRAGRMISRTGNNGGTDRFDVPVSMIPDGWSYQWIAVSVTGKPVNNTGMFQNGWEAVPAKRHDGVFMEKGHEGSIIIDDQMLCERRIELTLEARAEEIAAAKSLLRTQNDQFKPRLPDARNRRGTGLRVKRSIERLPDDIGRPDLRPDTGY